MADSIFTKIINGDIPSHKIYEDDKVYAFLDIEPFNDGHTLVIAKQQTGHLWDLDDDLYMYVMKIAKKVADQQRKILKPKRVGIIVEGFGVPDHAHVHVFPMNESLENTIKNPVPRPNDDQLKAMAEKLRLSDNKE